jgi:hypothetical protein
MDILVSVIIAIGLCGIFVSLLYFIFDIMSREND